MPTPERRVSLRTLRETVSRAVGSSGLRQVARESGLSAPAVSDFVKGARDPQQSTISKLEDWYLRHGVRHRGPPDETAMAAVAVLLDPLPEATRQLDMAELLRALARIFRRRGVPRPGWMQGGGSDDE